METWRDVPSLPDVQANNLGLVRMKPRLVAMPYGGVVVRGGKARPGVGQRPTLFYRGRNYRVSRLVCEAFYGPKPFDDAVVLHLDDDPANNRPENLKWGTQKENLNAPSFLAYCRSRTGDRNPYRRGRVRC